MMIWYDHNGHPGAWGWLWMAVGMLVFWVLVVTVVVLLIRAARRREPEPRPRPTPEHLLAERFARGEIDEDEYHRRLDVLRRSGHSAGT
ncbi:MAG TPA: SHOCT domain-containing protein [Mycobacteriales bacterium]